MYLIDHRHENRRNDWRSIKSDVWVHEEIFPIRRLKHITYVHAMLLHTPMAYLPHSPGSLASFWKSKQKKWKLPSHYSPKTHIALEIWRLEDYLPVEMVPFERTFPSFFSGRLCETGTSHLFVSLEVSSTGSANDPPWAPIEAPVHPLTSARLFGWRKYFHLQQKHKALEQNHWR